MANLPVSLVMIKTIERAQVFVATNSFRLCYDMDVIVLCLPCLLKIAPKKAIVYSAELYRPDEERIETQFLFAICYYHHHMYHNISLGLQGWCQLCQGSGSGMT